MQCPNCGADMGNTRAKFCSACGGKMGRSSGSGCIIALTIIGCIFLVLVVGVGIAIWKLQNFITKELDLPRIMCESSLHQITLGFQQYTEAYGSLPPAWTTDQEGRPMHSWRVLILPYVGENELYSKIRLDEPWDSEYNSQFHATVPVILTCHGGSLSDFEKTVESGESNYSVVVGDGTAFQLGETITFDGIKDGTSHTLAVVERLKSVPWMKPDQELTLDEVLVREKNPDPTVSTSSEAVDESIADLQNPDNETKEELKKAEIADEKTKFIYPELARTHHGCALVAFFDGSTRLLNHNISLEVLKSLFLRADGLYQVPEESREDIMKGEVLDDDVFEKPGESSDNASEDATDEAGMESVNTESVNTEPVETTEAGESAESQPEQN